MANIMKDVARALGVELGEEFNIAGDANKYKLSEYGLEVWSDVCKDWCPGVGIEDILIGNYEIIKLPKKILTEEEKEYLSSVIKPFRDRVTVIIKHKCDYSQDEYLGISVRYYNKPGVKEITLPIFEKDTMYKGMASTMWYTLEDLGL